jgi:hypothetical protein
MTKAPDVFAHPGYALMSASQLKRPIAPPRNDAMCQKQTLATKAHRERRISRGLN